MPSIDDYSPSDDEDDDNVGTNADLTGTASGSGPSTSPTSGGPHQATSSNQSDDSFVNWDKYVAANQDVSKGIANNLQNQVTNDVKTAQGDLSSAEKTDQAGIDANYSQPPPVPTTTSPKTRTTQSSSEFTPQEPSYGGFNPPPAPTNKPKPGQSSQGWSQFTGAAAAPDNTSKIAPPDVLPAHGFNWNDNPGIFTVNKQAPVPQYGKYIGVGNAPTGAKDLQAAVGDDAWNKLLGDTARANGEASVLGNEAGVQALLQSNQGTPETGPQSTFDAALVNGQGSGGFRSIANQFGGDALPNAIIQGDQNAQNLWTKLLGDSYQAPVDASVSTYNKPYVSPSFIPTVPVKQPGNSPISTITNKDALGFDITGAPPGPNGWDQFTNYLQNGDNVPGQSNYNINGPPNFRAVDPRSYGGGAGGSFPNGQVWFPLWIDPNKQGSAYGTNGIAWSDFWGDAKGAPANGATWNPDSLGLTGQEWWALGNMSPADRAAWWTQYGQALSDKNNGNSQTSSIRLPDNPLD